MKTPPLTLLQDMFVYDSDTGHFYRADDMSPVGGKSGGYLVLWINGRRHKAHRIAWAMHHKCEVSVDTEIDHINSNRCDNRILNLRLASAMQNMWNQRESKRNVSGAKGVNFDAQTGKWRARIEVSGRSLSLGRHATKEEAIQARKQAEVKHFGEYTPSA